MQPRLKGSDYKELQRLSGMSPEALAAALKISASTFRKFLRDEDVHPNTRGRVEEIALALQAKTKQAG